MIIGTFTKSAIGFNGALDTLTVSTKLDLVAIENPAAKGPHFRVMTGSVEIGAAWTKTAADSGREYLSVKIDDPTFAQPIYASLVEAEGGYRLIWNRKD
jgi:uncharacterized protein (DUF736 family)